MEEIRLTQFSHGAGCGCKISPGVLESILSSAKQPEFKNLLVGFSDKDDAAVFDLGDGSAIISTADFFMPIVDDPFDFGQIAAVNAISDVYAMGGQALLAIGILGWPVDKIDPKWAGVVIQGAQAVCEQAGIPLAGGHSIDSPEPIFGLAVTGRVLLENLKTNGNAKPGDLIYLTKALGVGILTTAEKKGIIKPEHKDLAKISMLKLNSVGSDLAKYPWVHALTDVTGFGLCGHLLEMCEASNLYAKINYVNLPVIDPVVHTYAAMGAIPGGTHRNWASYGSKIVLQESAMKELVADPQTSGGLLIAVDPDKQKDLELILNNRGCYANPIGQFISCTSETTRIELIK